MGVTANKSFTMTLVILVASSLSANQAPDKGKLKKTKQEQTSVIQIPKGLALDAQQKEALAALNAEFHPKLEMLKQQQEGILTSEQKQALADAKNAAKVSGKGKAQLASLLRDAVQLTDAQIQQKAEIKTKMVALNQQIRDRFMKLLSAEQREVLKRSKAEVKKNSAKSSGKKQSSKKPTAKKPAAKKPSGKEPAAKKPTAEKPAAKKPSGKKPNTEKPAAKKPSSKKPSAKKPTVGKPAAKKPTGKKPTGGKPAQKRAADKKASNKKSNEKKADAQAPAKKLEKEGKNQPAKKQTNKK